MDIKRPLITFGIVICVVFSVFSTAYGQEENSSTEVEEFDFANGLFARGMYDMSIKQYKDFLEKHPDSPYAELARYRIAESYYLSRSYDEALNKLDEFLEMYPDSDASSKAVLRKGQAYYMKGEYDAAENILTGILDSASEDEVLSAKYYLSNVYFRKGDRTKSKRILEDLLRSEEKGRYASYAYMNLGDIYTEDKDEINAARNYALAIKFAEGDDGLVEQARFRAAGAFFRSGNYAKAYEFYKKITDGTSSGDIFDRSAVGELSALHEDKKYDLMVSTANELLSRIKNDEIKAQVLFIIGNRYFNADNPGEAAKYYAQAFSLYPGTKFGVKAKLNECWSLYRLGEYDRCLDSIENYLRRDTSSGDEALYIKARSLSSLGRNKEAMEVYRDLEKGGESSSFKKEAVYDSGWLLDRMGDLPGAMSNYKIFITEYPDDKRSPSVLLKYAQGAVSLGDHKTAEKAYLDFLSKYGNSPLRENVLYQLGKLYMDNSMPDKGIEIYERLLKEYPDTEAKGVVLYGIGRGLQSDEKWEEAIDAFSKVTYEDGAEPYKRSKESIAYCFFRLGKYEKAADIYYELINGDGGYVLPEGVYRWCAEYYMRSDNKRSLEILGILLKNYPESDSSGEVSYLIGENYSRTGEEGKAKDHFQKAVTGKAPSPYLERAYLGLGRIALKSEEYDKALKFFNDALAANKDNATGAFIRFDMGNALYKKGDFEEAAKQYLMVAILYEDKDLCPKALFYAADSFLKAGNNEKAIEVFNELTERYPDDKLSKEAMNTLKRTGSEKQ